MNEQLVYRFEPGQADGGAELKSILGGKGANLAEMARLGIAVPPGFTITTELCLAYLRDGALPADTLDRLREQMQWLGARTGQGFGDRNNPLLVSVRSGARSSMPGMMDTILNLGLNDNTVHGLAERTGNRRFAYDAYRRLLTMYGDVVLHVDRRAFDARMDAARRAFAARRGVEAPTDDEELGRAIPDASLEAEDLEALVEDYKALLGARVPGGFPEDPLEQLLGAVRAVCASWNNPRAKVYRRLRRIPDEWGTAVNVQVMVFGNLGDDSGTGVAFTRDPSTGEKRFFGEWLPNAQGEDVVAGVRTPQPLAAVGEAPAALERVMPEQYRELFEIQERLERHYRDMQDLEFTIERGRLFILQTRSGKRSAAAEVRIAAEMVEEGMLTPEEALLRVDPSRLEQLLFPSVDPKADVRPAARGMPASPGVQTGHLVLSAEEAEQRAERGDPVILVRVETAAEDLHGMKVARGILTARGGATSHAAVVARGMGRSCVVGCSALSIDHELQMVTFKGTGGGALARVGDLISIDGSTGAVYVGDVPKVEPELTAHFQRILEFADAARRLRVRANADTPAQARQARSLGAEGIGLCRTEHMFFDEGRIAAVREMILAHDAAARENALAKLLPYQIEDFVGIFREMAGLPVTIRLLDPPLHEFLPTQARQIEALASSIGVEPADIEGKLHELHEYNPMLGHRGCRLGITSPEIYRMQVRAILEAATRVASEGHAVHPEIMIPLAMSGEELATMQRLVRGVADEVRSASGHDVEFAFGTMIELPRAAIRADELARVSEFFSFGTNDLTQTTLGVSRDDAGKFLPEYLSRNILADDPFRTIDRLGVGELMRLAIEKGRRVCPQIPLGICGEHAADAESVDFFEEVGLDYISCSPFRVPVARLAAAQAAARRRA